MSKLTIKVNLFLLDFLETSFSFFLYFEATLVSAINKNNNTNKSFCNLIKSEQAKVIAIKIIIGGEENSKISTVLQVEIF